ncbi:hypothetical protein EJ05DRAFT_472823 [Pseudovirgaria hyperparasitica]|uniref:Inclusion body clearance protein IML2 n=1 Tax=Pseudovirgaria hyperparasitica TaxID=470096 RepID=A0A6A6WI04_9PEZI|nr:uncharacterized protein EJ05DRAFT_472823 [Pseudovirgaria hyperparasitica]KAF2761869.1 hypothetical protein EJ05DRAFT_472823 [Pseudovirgaria hyperparasitica]
MSLRSLLGRGQPNGSTQSLSALDEPNLIADAMEGAALIMNDDVDGAETRLSRMNSPFHKMGQGVVVFLRATLGFEPEIMRQASEKLSEAESSAYEHHKHALKRGSTYGSIIYPAGTEFALCQAQAQLLGAVLAVLNESLPESIKGFYKMRKAYVTLDSILSSETAYVHSSSTNNPADTHRRSLKSLPAVSGKVHIAGNSRPGTELPSQQPSTEASSEAVSRNNSDDEDEFFEADEDHEGASTPQEYIGNLTENEPSDSKPDSTRSAIYQLERKFTSVTLTDGPEKELFSEHPTDGFIHAGSNLCFGILSLIISMIPPAFSMLLKIVGFHGDKERGIQMLWQSTKFNNVYAAIGGLVLFGYYHGIMGFCDIQPPSGPGSYPKEQLSILLVAMRERFPKSALWRLEEARMMANEKRLEEAVEFMDKSEPSAMEQIDALAWFERCLYLMYLHRYEETSKAFQELCTKNNWSHGLYLYIAASAHVELYRKYKKSEPDEAARQAKIATDLFHRVPQKAGRKRFLARQLPFDTFTMRKISKWDARARDRKIPFIDAIGVSPIEEIIYFWNGYKRMGPQQLQMTLANLGWPDQNAYHGWSEEIDEHSIQTLLKAITIRHMGDFQEGRRLLSEEIMGHDRALFKGHLKDSWTAPCARYEFAASLWVEMQKNGEEDALKLQEISGHLEEVSRWESYDLDARMGIRITTAKDTLKQLDVRPTI